MFKLARFGSKEARHLLLLIVYFIICNSAIAQKNKEADKIKIDSVIRYHFEFLDKIASLKEGEALIIDPPRDTKASVRFFETLTGIKSKADASYIGKTYASADEIRMWKEWIEANRNLLLWEGKKKRVNRKDKNIYKANKSVK